MSGIDAPQPWHAPSMIEPTRATAPPNGTRFPCPLCGCKPGEHHLREKRNSVHAHAYAHDPEDTALD